MCKWERVTDIDRLLNQLATKLSIVAEEPILKVSGNLIKPSVNDRLVIDKNNNDD